MPRKTGYLARPKRRRTRHDVLDFTVRLIKLDRAAKLAHARHTFRTVVRLVTRFPPPTPTAVTTTAKPKPEPPKPEPPNEPDDNDNNDDNNDDGDDDSNDDSKPDDSNDDSKPDEDPKPPQPKTPTAPPPPLLPDALRWDSTGSIKATFVDAPSALQKVLGISPANPTVQILDTHKQPEPMPDSVMRTTQINVTKMHTLEVAAGLQDAAVLNFANAQIPGGAARTQAQPQEESLCHCSNLLAYLEQVKDKYPMPDYSVLYSQGVQVVFKHRPQDKFEPLVTPFSVSVISAAAQPLTDIQVNGPMYETPAVRIDMLTRMIGVLRTALNKNHRDIVLGAWGCGASKHPPAEVAGLWRRLLLNDQTVANSVEYDSNEFVNAFDNVAFAIDEETFDAFRAAFP